MTLRGFSAIISGDTEGKRAMNAQAAFEKFNQLWISKGQPGLSDYEREVFLGIWENKPYAQMVKPGLDGEYLKETGSKLFKKINSIFEVKTKKINFKPTIEHLLSQYESSRDLNLELELTTIAEKSQSNNPFIPLTGIVDDPQLFFGREKEIRDIFEWLNSSSNVAVIGERAIGKSSLLKAIERSVNNLSQPRQPVYLTLQEVENEDEFYEYLCAEVGIDECSGYQLNRKLKEQRLLLLIDEIDKMSSDGFTYNIRDKLRALAEGIDAPLRLILAARVSLEDLFEEGKTSPLANICLNINLKPWDETTARAFIAQRLASTPVSFTEEEISKIIAETGGHPQQLMQRCHKTYADYLAKNNGH